MKGGKVVIIDQRERRIRKKQGKPRIKTDLMPHKRRKSNQSSKMCWEFSENTLEPTGKGS